MTETVTENRELLERHAEKDLPTSDLAEVLLDVADEGC